jgi:hypothetical protein
VGQNALDEAIERMIHKGRYFEIQGTVYKGVYSFSIEQLAIATSFCLFIYVSNCCVEARTKGVNPGDF